MPDNTAARLFILALIVVAAGVCYVWTLADIRRRR